MFSVHMIHAIKILRQKSGASVSRCKSALSITGSIEAALELLRKEGCSLSSQRNSSASIFSAVGVHVSNEFGSIVEVSSETDFAIRSEPVRALIECLPRVVIPGIVYPDQIEFRSVIHPQIQSTRLSDILLELSTLLGERINLERCATMQGNYVGSYIHGKVDNCAGTKAALVGFSGAIPSGFHLCAHDIARHVVATNPAFLSLEMYRASRPFAGDAQAEEERLLGEGLILEEAVICSSDSYPGTVKATLNKYSVSIDCFVSMGK